MLITLIVIVVAFFFFKEQILGLINPVLELWTRTFSVANTYMKGVEADLERSQALAQAEKKHNAKAQAETLKSKGITIDDLNLD